MASPVLSYIQLRPIKHDLFSPSGVQPLFEIMLDNLVHSVNFTQVGSSIKRGRKRCQQYSSPRDYILSFIFNTDHIIAVVRVKMRPIFCTHVNWTEYNFESFKTVWFWHRFQEMDLIMLFDLGLQDVILMILHLWLLSVLK